MKLTNTFFWKVFINTLLIILLIGCSHKRVELQPTIDSKFINKIHSLKPLDCQLEVTLVDNRTNKEAYLKSIETKHAILWFDSALSSIQKRDMPSDEHSRKVALLVDIRKVYISHISTSMSGIVLAKLQVNGNETFIRAQQTHANVWGATYEYLDLLNDVMFEWLRSAHPQLENACNTQKTA